MKIKLPRSVSTITPQRISFFGGGTDLPSYYSRNGGSVISTAIDQYVYVTVKTHSPLFNENYRLSYSVTEHADDLDKIENSIARECIRFIGIDPPVYISTAADLPSSSGLGSSSSFAVGLLHALHLLKGERVSPGQLAEEACEVEINILKNPIGKQDQYAAAFGGINHIKFLNNGRVEIDHIGTQFGVIDQIFQNSLLVWTGLQRDSGKVLSKQKENLITQIDKYRSLIQECDSFKELLTNPDINFLQDFGKLLNKAWETKKKLEESISTPFINSLHEEIIRLGGIGGKLCGAGGGGFLFELVPMEFHKALFEKFGVNRLMKIGFEPHGSRVLSQVY